jgi:hypothetical protein
MSPQYRAAADGSSNVQSPAAANHDPADSATTGPPDHHDRLQHDLQLQQYAASGQYHAGMQMLLQPTSCSCTSSSASHVSQGVVTLATHVRDHPRQLDLQQQQYATNNPSSGPIIGRPLISSADHTNSTSILNLAGAHATMKPWQDHHDQQH